MKTFQLNIASPCEENLDKMPKSVQGFFCNSCAKSVIDLSNKTDYEISRIISSTKDKNNICARLNASQINKPFELFDQPRNNSSLKYASAIAASVLLSTGVAAQEKVETKTEQTQNEVQMPGGMKVKISETKPENAIEKTQPAENEIFKGGDMAVNITDERSPYQSDRTITFQGFVINSETNKPFSNKEMFVKRGDSNVVVPVDMVTGAYSFKDQFVAKHSEALHLILVIDGGEIHNSAKIPKDLIDKGTVEHNIIVPQAIETVVGAIQHVEHIEIKKVKKLKGGKHF